LPADTFTLTVDAAPVMRHLIQIEIGQSGHFMTSLCPHTGSMMIGFCNTRMARAGAQE
jgi:hypothetical protein